ncbi:peroxisomal membrane protein 11C-like isoform X1 [Watersipora subatra]|uniref:peroxisomal membrane protein 11C-like isoform X1 n=1 Tax=Watersipora subatra TaxID=2589382 RepID=UPI00355B40D7
MDTIDKLAHLLKTQAWRDRFLRIIGFACQLVAARLQGRKLAVRFSLFGTAVSRTRAFTRFLDDIPMLQTTLGYGLGTEDEPMLQRILKVLGNLSSQLFFPVEHIAMFCQIGALPESKYLLWVGRATTLWAVSLSLALIRNILAIYKLSKDKSRLSKSSSDRRGMKVVDAQLRLQTLTVIKDLCDFANAINFLPYSILWNQKLSPTQSAAFGVVASALNMLILSMN